MKLLAGPTLSLDVDTLVDATYHRGYAETYDPPQPAEPEGFEIEGVYIEIEGAQVDILPLLTDRQRDEIHDHLMEERDV